MKSSEARIAIIVPWFGPLPPYFELFARSVSANPVLDYHLYTDQSTPPDCENKLNLIFHKTTFCDYCDRVSTELGISFHPQRAYKLCDLKPFYPLVHKEEMSEYEFVGFGDIDLILGDMQGYLDKILDKTDFFSAHADRVSGHFCFMRNDETYRQKALQIPDWQKYLTNQQHYGIDEGAFCDVVAMPLGYARRVWHRIASRFGLNVQWRILRFLSALASIFVPSRVRFVELHSTHSAISPDILKYRWTDTEWIYDGKKICGVNNGLSYPYLHFLFLKVRKEVPVSPVWGNDFYNVVNPQGKILITRNGIYNAD